MGNKQSVTITHQKADHDGIQEKKDKANGHALSGLDLTDAVTCETSMQQKSEPPPPVTVTNNIKLTPTSVELNGTQAKTPTMSVEAAGNHVSAITVSTEAKDTPKQPEISSMFNKMFKNKSKPVPPASEANIAAEEAIVSAVETESQNSNPSPASVEANSIQANTAVSVEAAGNQISATAESSTPAEDTPKQPEISSMFKMFKKKTGPVSPASEEPIVSAAESQKSNPAPVSVEVNGTLAKAAVSVEAAGNQISATAESTDSNTSAKDTPKQPEISSRFNNMFKKKSGPVSLASEANVAAEELIVSAVEAVSQMSNPAPVSVEVNGTLAKAAVSVEAAGNQTAESTDSNTSAKDTPKQPEISSRFNKMFKKKSGPVSLASEANVAAEELIVSTVEAVSQMSNPAPVSVEVNGTLAKAAVSVEAAGNQISATADSTDSNTSAKDTPKQPEISSRFNKMFKKKSGPVSLASEANVAAEELIVSAVEAVSQMSNPAPVSVEVNGTLAKAAVSVEAAGNQTAESTDSNTSAKDTPKQPEISSRFNKMFKKKSGPVSLASEANVAAEELIVSTVEAVSQMSNPAPVSVEVNGTLAKAAVSVEAAGNQISATADSTDSNTSAKDTPKQPEISSRFNKMFKKKSGPVSLASEANVAAEELIVSAVEAVSQMSNPAPVSVEVNGTLAKAAVSVEAAGNQTAESTDSNTSAKDTPKQPEISSRFNKMFKKKSGPVSLASEANVAAEELIVSTVEAVSQMSNPAPVSVEVNGTLAKAAVSVEAAGNQISATADSTDSNTSAKDTPKQPEISSRFNKMFKKKSGPVSLASEANVAAEELIVSAVEAVSQMSNPAPVSVEVNGTLAKAAVSVEAAGNQTAESTDSNTSAKDTPKQPEISSRFNKMFKKKSGPVSLASEANVAAEELIVSAVEAVSQMSMSNRQQGMNSTHCSEIPDSDNVRSSEPTDIKANRQAEKVPQGEAPSLSTTEVKQDSAQPEQDRIEEKSVMNFFKTFVSSTKTTKEATASPDVSKEQSKKETPPAPTANVPEASKLPPPPPPAPPKMESKAEPSVKKDEAPPIEVAASAAKQPETPSKTKTKNSSFSKLFRPKALLGKMSKGAIVPAKTSSASVVKEEAKPVEIQVDASKTSTLEAGAKAEPPPAPKAEEKKAEKKSSPFANMLKPKVLLGQVSAKIHAAASSAAAGISLGAGGAATQPKKDAAAAATAPAEAAASTKAKEEPKPAAPAAPAAASPDNKSVGSTDNSSPSTSRKLEKRNSIQLFFKNLGQKRHSDAGVQTEPAAPEKAK